MSTLAEPEKKVETNTSTTVVEIKVEETQHEETEPEDRDSKETTPDKVKPELPTIKAPKSPKPARPTIKTPISAFPSELPRSPASARIEAIKQEDDLKTPLTPPTAYTEFLKALSPAVTTPSTGRSPIFDRLYSGKTTPLTQPNSAASCPCSAYEPPLKTAASAPIIPPSPYNMRPPNSARTPTALRALRIPQSPVWSPASESPHSACHSLRSPFSSADWNPDKMKRMYESPRSATQKPVSVRQVVTRTVTYTRSPITPLDPAPKGKKRRME
ncbi:uncharacterized protein KY384_001933 [Bacidia gigantensis]|uniref:uncharacterized protein n=1 Tax=Bacidia gigantensis TaxID=2732470 RepID=UPI001D03ACF7|nr:uncharacterized protein KY384_001933 [Bacidia gigantensis]KAG8533150.1 hypothetical protein KY384_001933 [Bacidia gigantensis]